MDEQGFKKTNLTETKSLIQISLSRRNPGDRTELQEQYRAVSKELKKDIRREVIEFESKHT